MTEEQIHNEMIKAVRRHTVSTIKLMLSLYDKDQFPLSDSQWDDINNYLTYLGWEIPASLNTKERLDADFEEFLTK